MTYSFEIFDLSLHGRAYWSAADLERVGMLAELRGADTATAREFGTLTNRREMLESFVQVDVA
ncbi:MAG: hypothetical protein QM776_11385 [Rhodocyclaceae bacterium]